jgi:uncharacterized NAD-dependent epimerase/dehydratase family protein
VLLCEDKKKLSEIISDLVDQGIFIVSAFDNMGGISFPAAFPKVLGVDTSGQIEDDLHYEYIEGSIINIRGHLRKRKLQWKQNKQMILEGASFTAPIFTALTAKMLEQGYTRQDIYRDFKKYANSVSIHSHQDYIKPVSFINTAVIFPINKETHSLIEYNSMLPFSIMGIYDTKYLRNGSQKFLTRLSQYYNLKPNFISDLDFTLPFDTFILGHVHEIEMIEKKQYFTAILNNCLEYNKNVVVFDPVDDINEYREKFKKRGLNFYSPYQYIEQKPDLQYGKLGISSKPIVGVFGTSSKQGKFTLQLRLRQQFMKKGFKVGQIETEPQSELFGFDRVIPIGLHSPITYTPYEAVSVFNEAVMDIDAQGCDVIIVGSQSGSIPFDTINLKYFTLYQNEVLMSLNLDVLILCININDNIEYIERTIKYLESASKCTVLALVIFPVNKHVSYLTNSIYYEAIEESEIGKFRATFEKALEKKCFILGKEEDVLANLIEQFLTE